MRNGTERDGASSYSGESRPRVELGLLGLRRIPEADDEYSHVIGGVVAVCMIEKFVGGLLGVCDLTYEFHCALVVDDVP